MRGIINDDDLVKAPPVLKPVGVRTQRGPKGPIFHGRPLTQRWRVHRPWLRFYEHWSLRLQIGGEQTMEQLLSGLAAN